MRKPLLLVAFVLPLMLFVVLSGSAQAQPTLRFLNDPLKLTLGLPKQAEYGKCGAQAEGVVRTGQAGVYVLNGSEEKLEDLRFIPVMQPKTVAQVDVVPSREQPTGTSSQQVNSRDTVKVCWEDPADGTLKKADDNEVKTSIEPSDVKAFTLHVEVYSSRSPDNRLRDFLQKKELSAEYSSLSGQLMVTDSTNQQVTPGTLSLLLGRPVGGHQSTNFLTYSAASLCCQL